MKEFHFQRSIFQRRYYQYLRNWRPLPMENKNVKKQFPDQGCGHQCEINFFSDISDFRDLISAFREEITLLKKVSDSLQNHEKDTEETWHGWVEYHASMARVIVYPPEINTISSLKVNFFKRKIFWENLTEPNSLVQLFHLVCHGNLKVKKVRKRFRKSKVCTDH